MLIADNMTLCAQLHQGCIAHAYQALHQLRCVCVYVCVCVCALTCQQFKEYCSHTPQVCLGVILVKLKDLRRHVQGTATQRLSQTLSHEIR